MLLGRELPTWKQLQNKSQKVETKPYMETENTWLFAESCMSIHALLQAVRKNKMMGANLMDESREDSHKVLTRHTDGVALWLPDYFCNQTFNCFYENWLEINYYPIDSNMNPKWDIVREEAKTSAMDVFVFVHYFGMYHDISKALEICNLHEVILLEDCAHVLYPHPMGRIGKMGDFVIYSQHKQLPISDGAVLKYNPDACKKELTPIVTYLNGIYANTIPAENNKKWYQKKAVQKLTNMHRELPYSYGEHIGEMESLDYPIRRISQWSYNILSGYSYEDFKRIAYLRRDNVRVMNAVITARYPKVRALNPVLEDEVPYMAVFSMADVADESEKQRIVHELLADDFTILYWPDLPSEIKYNRERHGDALQLSKDIFVIPAIHQDIKPQQLIKKFGKYMSSDVKDSLEEVGPASIDPLVKQEAIQMSHLHLDFANVNREEWDHIYQDVRTTNIPQEWIYGNAKSATEGWKVRRALVRNTSGEAVGVLQLLVKKALGIPVAIRVNRGPVLLPEYDCIENHLRVMKELRKYYPHPLPIVWQPFVVWQPNRLKELTKAGWKCFEPFAYPSGYLNLSLSEEELNKGMKAFWRKHLKQARKQVEIRHNEYDSVEVRRLYAEFLERRQIPGIPDHILQYLWMQPQPPLEVLTAHNEAGEMIAYKVLYVHGNTGTSFIAWNTDEGLEKQARTLLIFESALRLKEMGCKYYDLGGIDDITTEAVARFKRGTGDTDYRLMGEFLHF